MALRQLLRSASSGLLINHQSNCYKSQKVFGHLYVHVKLNSNESRLCSKTSLLNHRCFSTSVANVDRNESVFNLLRRYEDLIGLTEVKEAQRGVLQAELDFQRLQEQRRQKQDEIRDVQDQLHAVRLEIDKTSRGEDRYLSLLTREHALIKDEQRHLDDFKRLEIAERESFTLLSKRLRDSHDKERERGEKTKYWSLIGSAIGAFIGVVGATVNNRLRLKEVKTLVEEASDPGRVHKVINQLSDVIHAQQQQVGSFVTDLKTMLNDDSEHPKPNLAITPLAHSSTPQDANRWLSPEQGDKILTAINEHKTKVDKEMQDIKAMIAAEHGYSLQHDGNIVYVGPEMVDLLDQTQKSIELKMKLNTLVTIVAVYGALAIVLPLLYAAFKGG